MTEFPASMSDVYRRFLEGALPLQDAALLLRQHARGWNTRSGSLGLDELSGEDRQKAAELLNESIQPALVRFLAGGVTTEAAAQEIAPLVLPLGVFALNVNTPSEGATTDLMARLSELFEKVAGLDE